MKRSSVIKDDGIWKLSSTRTNAPWFPPFDNKGCVSCRVQKDKTRTFVNESLKRPQDKMMKPKAIDRAGRMRRMFSTYRLMVSSTGTGEVVEA